MTVWDFIGLEIAVMLVPVCVMAMAFCIGYVNQITKGDK